MRTQLTRSQMVLAFTALMTLISVGVWLVFMRQPTTGPAAQAIEMSKEDLEAPSIANQPAQLSVTRKSSQESAELREKMENFKQGVRSQATAP